MKYFIHHGCVLGMTVKHLKLRPCLRYMGHVEEAVSGGNPPSRKGVKVVLNYADSL